MTDNQDQGGCIIEFVPHGKFMKVSAIDPETLVEVSIIGPVSASKLELQTNVLRKLEYVLNKGTEKEPESAPPTSKGRGGIIV